jgi:alkylation response protein AidB-like acyl-CoA dehydrogenase
MDKLVVASLDGGFMDKEEFPTRDILIQRARAMWPSLLERSEECEKNRRVSDETINDFRNAGFFRMGVPKKYGGYEMDYDVLCEVIIEIAHVCASSAWNLAVLGEHAYTLTNSTQEILDELWGQDPNVLIATGNDPKATLEPVDGGYIFNARTSFSSGCDHVDWWISRGTDTSTGNQVGVFIPKQENVTIIEDSWYMSGLSGSGSKDIEFNNVFIPMSYVRGAPKGPEWAGKQAGVSNGATYKLSQLSTKPFTLAAVSVGIAGGVLRSFTERILERKSRFGDDLSEKQNIHLRIAESSAEYDAARKILLSDIQESLSILRTEDDIPDEMHQRNRRDMAFCPRLAQASVDRLFYATGAGGLALNNNLQRQFRDVHAAGAQLFLNWDINATVYGRSKLGLEVGGPVI